MSLRPTVLGGVVLLVTVGSSGGDEAWAQAPTLPEAVPTAGASESALGPSPGTMSSPFGAPGSAEVLLGGRPGASTPRVPASATSPPPTLGLDLPPAIGPTQEAPSVEIPDSAALALPESADGGPADGLTLDAALDLLVQRNLDLKAKFFEIPQAHADVLTASLRANPLFYADSQLIPYGSYSEERPGGATQYDLNITFPLDVTHKRQARTLVASRVVRVLEAQYQDAVRLEIANLYTAFVDVLAARETIRFARAGVGGFDRIVEITKTQAERGLKTEADVQRAIIRRDAALLGVAEAEATYESARSRLASLLNLPPGASNRLELQGVIRDRAPSPPGGDALVALALASRPDLAAHRLGVRRAEAEATLARANRLSDIYLLVQPYTFQDLSPFDRKSAHSWAVGLTVPLPIHNRNQGNIERARINISQAHTELAALERAVVAEVEQAEREYELTRAGVERMEAELIPSAERVIAATALRYAEGEDDLALYLTEQGAFNALVRQYVDLAVRHRRAMLGLNTAVGRRLLP